MTRATDPLLRASSGLPLITRRRFVQGAAALGGAAFLAGCGVSSSGTPSAGSSGSSGPSSGGTLDTLNFGYTQEPQTLDPFIAPGIQEFIFDVNLMDGLYTTNQKLQPVPLLATSSKIVDPLTWEFTLQKGVVFHNGEPFTAESVQASYAHSMSTTIAIKNTWGSDINLDHVEIVDDYTVRFHTTSPTPFLLARIANDHYMMPPKWLASSDATTMARNPVGTGAYTFKEWVSGDHITLEANPNYWGTPKPAIKTVVFRFIPEEGTRIDSLKTHAVDLIDFLSPASVGLVAGQPGLDVQQVEHGRRVYAGFNTALTAVSDVRVRQAVNYGCDLEQICKVVFAGATTRLTNYAEPGFRDPSVKGYSYDVAKAKSLLSAAGFGSGLELTWDVDNASYLASAQFPEAVAASLADAGITIKINQIDHSIATTQQKSRKTNQMYLRSNAAYYDPITTFSILDPKAAGNGTQWMDQDFINLWTMGKTGGTPDQRLQWSYQMQAIVMDQAPMLFLWLEPGLFGVDKDRLHGFQAPADEHIRLNLLS